MSETEAFADALLAAHRGGQRVAEAPGPLSRAEVLAVQAQVSGALGPVAGFKVGRLPEGPPVLAPIPACYRVPDGGSRRVRDRLGVELEVGFELIRALPGPGLPPDPAAHFRPRAVFELVETRLAGAAADRPDLKFADLQITAGLVSGSGPEAWDGRDFGRLSARFRAGAHTVLEGETEVPGGSALANLDLLLRHLGRHCGGLQPGQTVITGSVCGLPWFEPGTELSAEIAGLGRVAVSLA
ncbi:hydratase [Rhodovulum kholense]|uniref:2-keto-4-pentenoate hydratase n=1 Tax=Rhodovulum kholense TaxID=453584 RepID=A0A8E2VGY7_9RHOB|nr:hydratase [Rhodovulum kholense]PTW44540.1 2-keto-4-pentenoate hydratase [Rhodovulum kholense]